MVIELEKKWIQVNYYKYDQRLTRTKLLYTNPKKMFRFQLKDLGHKAEAIMTKAVICRYDFNKQLKVSDTYQ